MNDHKEFNTSPSDEATTNSFDKAITTTDKILKVLKVLLGLAVINVIGNALLAVLSLFG